MNIEQKKLMHQQAKAHGFDDPVKLADELEQAADAAEWMAYPDRHGLWANARGGVFQMADALSPDHAFQFLLEGPWLRLAAPTLHAQCRDDLEAVQDAAATYERRIAQARAILDGNT